ncbi:MAG: hypothetical protein J0M04_16645 [Verrucomicrobia bacterium]|nr:hypothetical protein [Verrucomicrobiota bacterium]
MKAILTILVSFVTISPFLRAQMLTDGFEFTEPIEMPHTSMRDMLGRIATWSGKQVVVASEEDLKPVISLILPSPVSGGTVRKVIDALLLLEGYELIESGEKEIHLHRILTPEQCAAINKGIGHIQIPPDKLPARERVAVDSRGAVIPTKELVVIRPSIQREVGQPGAGQPAAKPAEKDSSAIQPSPPASEDATR